jgi:hypothetical protein
MVERISCHSRQWAAAALVPMWRYTMHRVTHPAYRICLLLLCLATLLAPMAALAEGDPDVPTPGPKPMSVTTTPTGTDTAGLAIELLLGTFSAWMP